MDAVAKSEIFFVITSAVVVVLGILLAVLFFYFVKIAKDLKAVSNKIKEESEKIAGDIQSIRERVQKEGSSITSVISFAKTMFKNRIKQSKPKKNSD